MPKNISTEIMKITESTMHDKIYLIRGQQVMLDYDLAEIYGYTTKAFNQQVKNNIEKFEDEDFMFRLTKAELEEALRSRFFTSNTPGRGGLRYLPYAFTEQGIYMLMTILRGELATKQSKTLIRLFKRMKDYIITSNSALEYRNHLQLVAKVAEHSEDITEIKQEISTLDNKVNRISNQMGNLIKRSEISPILLDFTKDTEMKEFLILNGELTRAKETFLDIYAKAKKTIYIIDNYINLKTLHLLQSAKSNIEIIIFTDNNNKYLRKSDYQDFITERPDLKLKFIKTNNQIHDRFIILDNETIYHCGISSKDVGNKITIIQEVTTDPIKTSIKDIINNLSKNEELKLD